MIWCYCDSCKHHDNDNTCKLRDITISDQEMTAAGFLPQCQEYEEAEAQAKANEMIAKSLTEELIENNKINKWNGEVPTVSGSGATIVDIGNVG